MNIIPTTHPHAQTAVLLASFNNPDRAHVNRELLLSGTPRRLYALARVLRAVQLMDEVNAVTAMQRAATRANGKCLLDVPARDLVEHLEIARAFNGNNHAQLAERYCLTEAEVYRSLKASATLAKAA